MEHKVLKSGTYKYRSTFLQYKFCIKRYSAANLKVVSLKIEMQMTTESPEPMPTWGLTAQALSFERLGTA